MENRKSGRLGWKYKGKRIYWLEREKTLIKFYHFPEYCAFQIDSSTQDQSSDGGASMDDHSKAIFIIFWRLSFRKFCPQTKWLYYVSFFSQILMLQIQICIDIHSSICNCNYFPGFGLFVFNLYDFTIFCVLLSLCKAIDTGFHFQWYMS